MAMVICSMSCTLALVQLVRRCVCVQRRGEWSWERLLTFQIPCRTDTLIPHGPPSAKPERSPQWYHLQVLMDYTAASIWLRHCYWWMRVSVIHRASMPVECLLIIKWWMSVRISFFNLAVLTSCAMKKAVQNVLIERTLITVWVKLHHGAGRASVALIGSRFRVTKCLVNPDATQAGF